MNGTDGVYDNSHSASAGRTHFSFTLNGVDYAFAYIRKNGCSAVTRMIAELSPRAKKIANFPNRYDFLRKHHKTPPAGRCGEPTFFFVYRDPIERLASLYVNKLVVRSGNAGVIRDVASKLGGDPYDLTFDDFALAYVCAHHPDVDKHCLAQSAHLRPVGYAAAIPLSDLRGGAGRLFGAETADRFFSQKHNPNPGNAVLDDARDMPAGRLSEIFRAEGVTPGYRALVGPDTEAAIRNVYADDYAMISAIEGSAAPGT